MMPFVSLVVDTIRCWRLTIVPDKSIREIEYPFCNTDNMNAERFQKYRYYLVFVQVCIFIIVI